MTESPTIKISGLLLTIQLFKVASFDGRWCGTPSRLAGLASALVELCGSSGAALWPEGPKPGGGWRTAGAIGALGVAAGALLLSSGDEGHRRGRLSEGESALELELLDGDLCLLEITLDVTLCFPSAQSTFSSSEGDCGRAAKGVKKLHSSKSVESSWEL